MTHTGPYPYPIATTNPIINPQTATYRTELPLPELRVCRCGKVLGAVVAGLTYRVVPTTVPCLACWPIGDAFRPSEV